MNHRIKQSLGENLRIIDWIKNHQPSIAARRSLTDIADWASRELYFEVTESNILHVLRTLKVVITKDMTAGEIWVMLNRAFPKST